MLPVFLRIPSAVILLAGGAMACFAGYRLFRAVLTVYGFILGALMASSLMGPTDTWGMVIAALVGGAIGAAVLNFGYFLGVVLVGAALGAALATLVWTWIGREPHALVVVGFSVAGAIGAMLLQRLVIIAVTALAGAWTMLVGGLALAGDKLGLQAASGDAVWIVYPWNPAPGRVWVLVVFAALAVAGFATQLRGKPPKKAAVKKKAKAS